jgi:DNA-binding NarL/FixJ family response regulator
VLRVVLAGHDESLNRWLAGALAPARQFELVGTAVDGETALDLVTRGRPDVAVVDAEVAMPPADGRTLVQAIREVAPETWLVVLADDVSSEAALAALAAGATGVLAKDGSAELLAEMWSHQDPDEGSRAAQ